MPSNNYKVKQTKNSQFTYNYKASPIYFETQISLHTVDNPSEYNPLQKQAPQKGPLKNTSPGTS